jgi:hypothetical protein
MKSVNGRKPKIKIKLLKSIARPAGYRRLGRLTEFVALDSGDALQPQVADHFMHKDMTNGSNIDLVTHSRSKYFSDQSGFVELPL